MQRTNELNDKGYENTTIEGTLIDNNKITAAPHHNIGNYKWEIVSNTVLQLHILVFFETHTTLKH